MRIIRALTRPDLSAPPTALNFAKIFPGQLLFVNRQLDISLTTTQSPSPSLTMAPSNLPPSFNATSKDIEDLLAAQAHLGSKNLQTHMEPYVWKTRPDGINVINIGKTWYVISVCSHSFIWRISTLLRLPKCLKTRI
jgi:hypothetical protein